MARPQALALVHKTIKYFAVRLILVGQSLSLVAQIRLLG